MPSLDKTGIPGTRRGRRPAGDRALTPAERQKAYRERQKARLVEALAAVATAALPAPHVDPSLPTTPLPCLTGSPAQVAWAEEIRRSKLYDLRQMLMAGRVQTLGPQVCKSACVALLGFVLWRRLKDAECVPTLSDDELQQAVTTLHGENRARWWIDYRGMPVPNILASIVRYQLVHGGGRDEALRMSTMQAKAKADALAEATVKPEGQVNGVVVELSMPATDCVRAYHPGYDEAFNALVKARALRWAKPYWERMVEPGISPVDAAVRLAHDLLAKGYALRIFDAELRGRVIAGDYDAPPDRLIKSAECKRYGRKFKLCWPADGLSIKFVNALRSLRGAKVFDNAAFVPVDQWEAVAEFAEDHGFVWLEDGKAVLEIGQRLTAARTVAKVKVKAAEVVDVEHVVTLGPLTGEVDADLLDD